MNWRRSSIGLLIAVPIVALLGYGLTRDPTEIISPLPGRTAPAFELRYMDQEGTASLEALRGKVVVLNFFASWCLECRVEHQNLSTAARLFAGEPVQFLGVLWKDTPENGRRWIAEMGGQAYPALVDGDRTAIDYGLYGVPETFVIDQTGVVAYKKVGPATVMELQSVIGPLLARSGTAPVP